MDDHGIVVTSIREAGNRDPRADALHKENEHLKDIVAQLMTFCERLDEGLKLATATLAHMNMRVTELEKAEKRRNLNPAILNSSGQRVN